MENNDAADASPTDLNLSLDEAKFLKKILNDFHDEIKKNKHFLWNWFLDMKAQL